MKCSFSKDESWAILSPIEQGIKRKIEAAGVPLKEWDININRGILTGCNDAFIIDGAIKDRLIAEDPKSAEIIRPILRGKDIKRYSYKFDDKWLIASHNGYRSQQKGIISAIDINEYPAIKQWLISEEWNKAPEKGTSLERLSARGDKGLTPFNLRDCAYMDDFSKQKIVYREISDAMNACMVKPGIMINNKCYMITGHHLIYLLAYFNSELFTKIVLPRVNCTGGKGENFLNTVCAAIPLGSKENLIINKYNSFINGECSLNKFDQFANKYFCELYGLTKEETDYICDIN